MAERYGDYELIQQIATGGMAEIHLARQMGGGALHEFKLNRLVIIKRMLPQLAVRPDFVQMFLDEARLTSSLQHPNIVRVHDLGEVAGSYFISMELVDGPHLGSLFAHSLRARKPLPIELCGWICARAADGLHYAHECNDPATGLPLHLVHRDISPQNILVSKNGESKVTDFGVAKASNQQTKTRTGIIKGKVAYMSPEQCLGDVLDRRSDVFALGIVLYELLTRRRLFRDKSDLLIMQKITGEDVAAASSVNPALDPVIDGILKKALSRDLDHRYATADEMASDIDGWLAGRAEERAVADWFEENCPDLAPSASLTETTLSMSGPAPGPESEKTSATPSLSSAETMRHAASDGSRDAGRTELAGVPARDEPTAFAPVPDFGADADSSKAGPIAAAPAGPVLDDGGGAVARRSGHSLPRAALAGGAVAVLLAIGVGFAVRGSHDEAVAPVVVVVDAGASAVVGGSDRQPQVLPATGTGKLKIETVPPGVAIIVGDRVIGRSPLEVDVPAGKAAVQAQFADQPPRTADVDVPAGGNASVLLKAWVPLVVRSTPSKAKVRVDGQLRGETPYEQGLLIEPGVAVKLRVDLPGMQAFEDTVVAEPGKPLVVEARLVAERSAPVARVVEYGALSVRTEPWAHIRFGDEKLGDTPFREQRVKAGRSVMVVSNPQYGINEAFPVTVPKGKTVVVILRFEKSGTAFKLVDKTIR